MSGVESSVSDVQVVVPNKKAYRQRAHSNPLVANSFLSVPKSPEHVDWSMFYNTQEWKPFNTINYPVTFSDQPIIEDYKKKLSPTILDIGCGYGGLSLRLAEVFPEARILGLEIRDKVAEFVGLRIHAARIGSYPPLAGGMEPIYPPEYETPESRKHDYRNVQCIRYNTQKYLINMIRKESIEKMFFCFPDPHFKRQNWRRRIVNNTLLSQYCYLLKPKGRIYTVTDCWELHEWMLDALLKCRSLKKIYVTPTPEKTVPRHAYDAAAQETISQNNLSFQRSWDIDFGNTENDSDPCPSLLGWATEESQKVLRNNMGCYITIFEKSI